MNDFYGWPPEQETTQ